MKKRSVHRRDTKGFTLIELMVVIAIIAALAGVTYPAYISYINKSSRTACMANLREIYGYGSLYHQEHAGILPCSGMRDDRNTPNLDESQGWWVALVPYIYPSRQDQPDKKTDPVRLPKTFACPADPRIGKVNEIAEATPETVSYVSWTDNSSNKRDPGSPIQITRGQTLSGVPWISDGLPQRDRSIRTESDFETHVLPESEMDRHGGYVCVVYADGSVKEVENATFKKVAPGLDPHGPR